MQSEVTQLSKKLTASYGTHYSATRRSILMVVRILG
jgi:hypothetical protein